MARGRCGLKVIKSMSMRSADPGAGTIDYRLNILGIRVSEHGCQLVAKGGDGERWNTIGPRRDLPALRHLPGAGGESVQILKRTEPR